MTRMFAAACLFAASTAFAADAYPVRPVRVIVPFAPGGATDIVTRLVAQKLGESWGQTVVVDNRAGAGGNIGGELAARSNPDGYTLLMTSGSIVTANPHMYAKMPFSPEKDLVAVTNVASGPQAIVVNPSHPAKTLKEFIAMAKAKPKSMTFGSAGVGTQTHLAAENFVYTAGIDVTHVPYKGEGPAVTDLVGGQIQFVTPNLSAAIAFVNSGKLRALAVTGKERSPQLPNVPAVAETLPGFENLGWFGFMVPTGTPQAAIDKVYADTVKALRNPDLVKRFNDIGMVPVGNSPQDFARDIKAESARWAKIIKERNLLVK
ncbi:MAG: tripartite tricarboxylate transporter substrate binding protein [Burkholderiales bacterium]|nr:tripartite tricarboxylate transporter substrate binding protein [Burkholderiales bacterium]MCW5606178.1 tripartite tricarboxylate transporter substrate binding protein [Burkholderiales bacterium]